MAAELTKIRDHVAGFRKFFPEDAFYSTIENETAFGYSEIAPLLAGRRGMRVLEVGSGTGMLLSTLAALHPEHDFVGVEPVGEGFERFNAVLDAASGSGSNLKFIRASAETADLQGRFDLAFSINVFEHIPDWRLALRNVVGALGESGQLIILCPNYTVPFESHFGIPVILNKSLTERIFRKRIDEIETRMNAHGLYRSINLITSTRLREVCQEAGLACGFDRDMMGRIFSRLGADAAFTERQGPLGALVAGLHRIGVTRIFAWLPAAFSPYMRVRIAKRSG